MEEKYFIIDKNNKECGAFTEDELNDIGLYEDSLIFCSDWSERKPLNQIPELSHVVRKNESILTINSQYGKNIVLINPLQSEITYKKELVNPYSYSNKKVRFFVVSWFFFHLMALIFAIFKIQTEDNSNYNKFWPFVNYLQREEWHPTYAPPYNRPWSSFNGVFHQYDISEFAIYNILFAFIWFLLYTKNQKN